MFLCYDDFRFPGTSAKQVRNHLVGRTRSQHERQFTDSWIVVNSSSVYVACYSQTQHCTSCTRVFTTTRIPKNAHCAGRDSQTIMISQPTFMTINIQLIKYKWKIVWSGLYHRDRLHLHTPRLCAFYLFLWV